MLRPPLPKVGATLPRLNRNVPRPVRAPALASIRRLPYPAIVTPASLTSLIADSGLAAVPAALQRALTFYPVAQLVATFSTGCRVSTAIGRTA
ncbi:hypothetical protein [Mycobacteroides franklinii]|uniref:Uncharacterized protein n=1 Tax=Mycobacteroides franklinii TaxID=948102 RepID=A0A4R5PB86_9MYCO|nr:hypothetical protein [Mycobacteroides franklinii]ORA61320.1 hypothetical protein BST24_11050 [Mycobacteroides franklinii]TDH22013.1 hypothetical protein EJ571_08615 [Mycobacteroides franklinii]